MIQDNFLTFCLAREEQWRGHIDLASLKRSIYAMSQKKKHEQADDVPEFSTHYWRKFYRPLVIFKYNFQTDSFQRAYTFESQDKESVLFWDAYTIDDHLRKNGVIR